MSPKNPLSSLKKINLRRHSWPFSGGENTTKENTTTAESGAKSTQDGGKSNQKWAFIYERHGLTVEAMLTEDKYYLYRNNVSGEIHLKTKKSPTLIHRMTHKHDKEEQHVAKIKQKGGLVTIDANVHKGVMLDGVVHKRVELQEHGKCRISFVHNECELIFQQFCCLEENQLLEEHDQGRYKLISHLCRGGFGQVWKAFDVDKEHFCTVKTPNVGSEEGNKLLEYEAGITGGLDHEGVINIIELFESSGKKYLAMEFSPYGCFRFDIKKHGPMTETRCMLFFKQIFLAMEYIHSHGVVHRGVKPENFLIFPNNQVKMIDFKHACRLDDREEVKKVVGMGKYQCPEMIAAQVDKDDSFSYNEACDIWGVGMCLFYCLTSTLPYQFNPNLAKYRDTMMSKPRSNHPEYKQLSRATKEVMLKCLKYDARKRPTAEELVQYDWRLAIDTIIRDGHRMNGSHLSSSHSWMKFKSVVKVIKSNDEMSELMAHHKRVDGSKTGVNSQEGSSSSVQM